jgi:hypothetical protein
MTDTTTSSIFLQGVMGAQLGGDPLRLPLWPDLIDPHDTELPPCNYHTVILYYLEHKNNPESTYVIGYITHYKSKVLNIFFSLICWVYAIDEHNSMNMVNYSAY